jgi:RNA polymerase primary sigma factor
MSSKASASPSGASDKPTPKAASPAKAGTPAKAGSTKPAAKSEKSEKSEKVPAKEAKSEKPAAKPAPKPAAKSEPKSEAKAPAKPEAKAASKPSSKSSKGTDGKASKTAAAPAPSSKPAKVDPNKRRIDTPEIQEKIRELIKLAKEQDYLTYDDINEVLPNDLVDPDDVEAIMERLRNMEFDIIDASEVDRYKDKKRDESDVDDEETKSDQKLDILDDPVRMYLKQMGQVPLLTREQEVEISKRIEDAEIEVAKHLHLFGFVADSYLDLADKLNKGK